MAKNIPFPTSVLIICLAKFMQNVAIFQKQFNFNLTFFWIHFGNIISARDVIIKY